MGSRNYSFLDVAALKAVGARLAAGEALVVLDLTLSTVLWANGAGASLFGTSDPLTFIGSDPGLRGPVRRQIEATSGFPSIGQNRNLVLRLAGGLFSRTTAFWASEIEMPDGEVALVFASVPAQARPEAAIEGLSGAGQYAALLDGAGTVVAAADGFETVGIAPQTLERLAVDVRSEADRIVKRPVRAAGGAIPCGIVLLRDEPPLSLLVVVDEAEELDEDDAPAGAVELPAEPASDAPAVGTPDVVLNERAAKADPADATERVDDASAQPDADAVALVASTTDKEDDTTDDAVEPDAAADDEPAVLVEQTEVQSEAEPVFAPTPAVELAAMPVRFVWRTDSDTRFTTISDEFRDAFGAGAADVIGRRFSDVAQVFGMDPDGEIAGLLARRDTWSGRAVLWPVAGTDLRVPVDLAALPVYDRDRNFEGFRGFGVARMGDAVVDPDAIGLALGGGATEQARPAEHTDEEGAETADPFRGEAPALQVTQQPERRDAGTESDKVIRLAERRPARDLSTAEQNNFREIGARLRDSGAAEPSRTGDAMHEAEAASSDLATQPSADADKAAAGEAPSLPSDVDSAATETPDFAVDMNDERPAGAPTTAASSAEGDWPGTSTASGADDMLADDDSGVDDAWPFAAGGTADTTAMPAVDTLSSADELLGAQDALHLQGDAEGAVIASSTTATDDVTQLTAETSSGEHSTAGGEPLSEVRAEAPEHVRPEPFDADDAHHADTNADVIAAGPTDAERDATPTAEPESGAAIRRDMIEGVEPAPLPLHDVGEPTVAETAGEVTGHEPNGAEGDPAPAEPARTEPEWAEPEWAELPDEQQGVASPIPLFAADSAKAAQEDAIRETVPERFPAAQDTSFAGHDEDDLPDVRGVETAVLSRLPLPIVIHRGDELLFANRDFLQLTGYVSLEELDLAGGLGALFGDPYLQGEDRKLRLRTRDGGELPVDAHLQSVAWQRGKALLLSVRPLTEATPPPSGEDRDARLEELRTIIDTATDGVVLIENDATIRSISRPAEALFGFDAEDVRGKPFSSLFAMESQRAARDYLASLADNGVASVLNDGREVIGRESQGGFIPLFMTIGRLPRESGYCAVVRDITQFKRAEEELTQARAQAERASSQKTDFLARVSHEIRTPLNAIIGFSELMLDEKFGPITNERYKDYLRDINRSGNHVLDLVNDLLDISKIEAGQLEMNYEAVSLNETLSDAVAMMQPQANRERVIIRSSYASRLPDVVADLRSIRQIALNLLSNAIRYTPAGGQVIVSTSYEGTGDIVMRVRDTGIGMAAAEIEQALKPFKQINALKRPRGDGTGLGLPLTKAMVEANRARFAIQSTPGEGTLVEITFPSTRVLAH